MVNKLKLNHAVKAVIQTLKIWIMAKNHMLITGVVFEAIALICICLSMDMVAAVLAVCSLFCFCIDDAGKEKGGKKWEC